MGLYSHDDLGGSAFRPLVVVVVMVLLVVVVVVMEVLTLLTHAR